MTDARISGGGYVSGTLTSRVVLPASETRSGQVGARIECDDTGSRRAAPGPVLEDVEDAVAARIAPGQERRPRRPGMRGQARTADAAPSALYERCECGELTRFEERIEDVPVSTVPADDEHTVGHGPER